MNDFNKLAKYVLNAHEKTAYKSYRISNFEELVDGLKEIGAPVSLSKADKSIKVDGTTFRLPKDDDTMKSVKFDDKIMDELRKNSKLMAMWKPVHAKFSNILKNIQSIKISDPKYINWGVTGASEINEFYRQLRDALKIVEPIIADKKTQDELRKYEVLRHLFDRGYTTL